MTTLVFLIRHAAHAELGRHLTGRKAGVQLSEAGKRQAIAVGRRLGEESLAALHTSPCTRARSTAAIIARYVHLPVQVAPALDEIDFGDWTGAEFEALAKEPLWRQWNEARGTSRPPNGETMGAATGRMVDHLEQAAETYAGSRVAFISHCDMIRGVIAHYLGLPFDRMLRFEVDCASISTLRFGAGGARLASLNEKVVQ